MTINMAGPQGKRDVIERNNVDLIQVLALNDSTNIAISPVCLRAVFSDWRASQLHACSVPLARPVAVRSGKVLSTSLSPDHTYFLHWVLKDDSI